MSRPNILFFMTDEQRYDTLSWNNPVMKTPNLEQLAKNSLDFVNARSSNPSCIPSRAAIVTGKYPTVCQCPTFITKLPKDETTFMTKLQQAGYYTSVVGKQHFAHSEIARGYDYEMIVDGHGPKGNPAEIGPYLDYLEREGVRNSTHSLDDLIVGGTWLTDVKYHIDSFIGMEGNKWLKHHLESQDEDSKKPWFYTVSFPGPHQPYDCEGTKYADLYDLKDMNLSESTYDDLKQKPHFYYDLNPRAHAVRYSEETFRRTKRSYYANISLIDEKIGEIIQTLKDHNQYDNTLIIFTADHGDFMGDYGLLTKAQYLCDSLMRVPLLVKPPIKDYQGRQVEDYVTNINIASTCLKVAGAEDLITEDMENHPFTDYWENPDFHSQEEYLYMEAHDLKGIIMDDTKVIYYVDRDYGELYDLKKDPKERFNLWDDPDYQDIKHRAMGKIIDKMFKMSPKSNIHWNRNAPSI